MFTIHEKNIIVNILSKKKQLQKGKMSMHMQLVSDCEIAGE